MSRRTKMTIRIIPMTVLLSSSLSSFTEVWYWYLMQQWPRAQGVAGACYAALLLPQDLLDLADLFLNLPRPLFVFTFAFQIGIHAEFPGDLLDRALHFVKFAFRLVLRAGFHGIPLVGI